MKPDFSHASEAFKRLNPHLCGVGGLRAAQPEPADARALDGAHAPQQGGAAQVGDRLRVAIVVFRRRLVDDDNLVGGCKYLRDAIAASLRRDDAAIDWEYHQVVTKGKTGTVVRIQQERPKSKAGTP